MTEPCGLLRKKAGRKQKQKQKKKRRRFVNEIIIKAQHCSLRSHVIVKLRSIKYSFRCNYWLLPKYNNLKAHLSIKTFTGGASSELLLCFYLGTIDSVFFLWFIVTFVVLFVGCYFRSRWWIIFRKINNNFVWLCFYKTRVILELSPFTF